MSRQAHLLPWRAPCRSGSGCVRWDWLGAEKAHLLLSAGKKGVGGYSRPWVGAQPPICLWRNSLRASVVKERHGVMRVWHWREYSW